MIIVINNYAATGVLGGAVERGAVGYHGTVRGSGWASESVVGCGGGPAAMGPWGDSGY
ncbi:MAG: hypothetical protein ACYTEL_20640 [Planctomycetota bacterium]